MKILVIGGSQFLGPAVVDALLANGHDISVFNRGRHPKKYSREVNLYVGDRNKGFGLNQKFDAVVDICAYTAQQTAIALKELQFNYFLHVSTAAVYAKSAFFPLQENFAIGEWPVWGKYNQNKVACEQYLQKSGINYAVLRPVYILGKENNCDRENFIYSRIKNCEALILPGNGEALVQFVFVQDVARSIVALVERQTAGAFNCAGDEIITLNGLVKMMASIIGKSAEIKHNQATDCEKFNEVQFPFANENFFCDSAKIKKLCPNFTTLSAGLTADYNNYYKFL